jgi:hypothetical protein
MGQVSLWDYSIEQFEEHGETLDTSSNIWSKDRGYIYKNYLMDFITKSMNGMKVKNENYKIFIYIYKNKTKYILN